MVRNKLIGSSRTLALALMLVACWCPSPSRAAWSLLDNFDSYDNSGGTALGTTPGNRTGDIWVGVFDGTGAAHIVDEVAPDQAAKIYGVDNGWRGMKTNLATNWAAGLAHGATGTYFFQFNPTSTLGFAVSGFDCMMGLSDGVGNIDSTNAWQDFAVMPFFTGAADGTADFKVSKSGQADIEIIPNAALDTWYNVWLVVNNSAKTYDVYTSTGNANGVLGASGATYRNSLGTGALGAFGFMQGTNKGNAVLFDNLYYTPGVDTTHPMLAQPDLSAIVDTTTGATVLKNLSSAPITISYYLLESAGNSLDPTGWNSMADREAAAAGDFNNDGAVNAGDLAKWQGDYATNNRADADADGDSDGQDFLIWQRKKGQNPGKGNGWEEAGGSNDSELSELNLFGDLTLAPNQTVDLGLAFDPTVFGSGNDGDLTFAYAIPGQAGLRYGDVIYIGGGASIAAVPEPGVMPILLSMIGCLAGKGRRSVPD